MKNIILWISIVAMGTITAQKKSTDKLAEATKVIENLLNIEETVPLELLEHAEGVIVIPKLVNAGFMVGGKRGKGIAFIEQEDGDFSNPVYIQLTGGSIGFQAGVQSIDLVLLVKSRETLLDLGKSDFTLGGDISVAAGPVGRNSSARTNEDFTAEVISYSKSKGVFAGISLDGALLKVDNRLNKELYGQKVNIAIKLNEVNSIDNASYNDLLELLKQPKR